MYSQGNEEEIILAYFKDFKGSLLDCAANDGITFSNSLALMEFGWRGVLIEPSKQAFEKLQSQHLNNYNAYCFNLAIGNKTGEVDFFDSGTLLNKGDSGLVSTLKKTEIDRWGNTVEFIKSKTDCYTWNDFYEISPIKKFDFISLDVEGMELDILRQMDLKEMECKLIVAEWNGKHKDEFDKLILPSGMKLIHTNQENLIYAI